MSSHSLPPSGASLSRILICTDAITGSWHSAMELAAALKSRRIEVTLAVVGPELNAAQRGEVATYEHITVHERPFALEWMSNPWDDVARAGEWLLALEERYSPDVIHLNHYSYAALPWSSPVVLTAHNDRLSWARAVGCSLPVIDEERYRSEMLAGLKSADQVVAPTRAVLNALCQHYCPSTTQSDPFRCAPRVIPYGRSREGYRRRPKREFILAAGCASDPGKNLVALERAAVDLPWPIYLAGSTEGAAIEFFSVDCLGPLAATDLANWMSLASVFVLPSRYESTGLAATEAALCGCALILSDLPNLRESWCNAALFVDPDQPLELANALQKLIRTPDLRQRLGGIAHKRAVQLSTTRMLESYLECYHDAIARQTSYPPEAEHSASPTLR